jgi:hypothetical protein
VSLISSAGSEEESAFLDASETGDDVFFLTASRLAAGDVDGALDLYDAHVCSAGSPCFAPAAPPVTPCEGESCQPAGTAPIEATPGTSTFVGPANSKPKCAKGKVRKHGKCVAKKSKKQKHHKRSKKRHAKVNRGGAK